MKSTKVVRDRMDRRPINKYSENIQTVEQELKLIETAIIMNKTQVKIYMDGNRFKEMARAAQELEQTVVEYNNLYERTYHQ